ncbi:uncharacterized protein [Palaemon carinicauda]|uniref:uncharacterized protein n=1 Tax=Palaemon carinicauda TaxID=392227 RepID=UPI0035B67B02
MKKVTPKVEIANAQSVNFVVFIDSSQKVINNRTTNIIEEKKPREQDGFRGRFSTTDNLQTVNQINEKIHEYITSIALATVGYINPPDSVETGEVMLALKEQGVESIYNII